MRTRKRIATVVGVRSLGAALVYLAAVVGVLTIAGGRDAEFGAMLAAVLFSPDLHTLIASAPAVMVGMSLGHLLRIAGCRVRGTRDSVRPRG